MLKSQYLNINVTLQNYDIEETLIESTAGVALLTINKKHAYKTRTGLTICKPEKLESAFAEVILPKKSNLLVGYTY